jgi:hypothetical protein
MTLIKVPEIWDVTALRLNRNLVLRFTKGGGAQENDEGCICRGDQKILDN